MRTSRRSKAFDHEVVATHAGREIVLGVVAVSQPTVHAAF
jgi:hypothetical protein